MIQVQLARSEMDIRLLLQITHKLLVWFCWIFSWAVQRATDSDRARIALQGGGSECVQSPSGQFGAMDSDGGRSEFDVPAKPVLREAPGFAVCFDCASKTAKIIVH